MLLLYFSGEGMFVSALCRFRMSCSCLEGGACPIGIAGSLHLSGQQERRGCSTVRAPKQCSLLWAEFAARNV